MSDTITKDLETARKALAHYLSAVFGIALYFPESLGKEYDGEAEHGHSFGDFISLLPLVRQKTVTGKNSDFLLPLTAKQFSLTTRIGVILNTLLKDGHLADVEIPIFFYPDGSTMVINFDPVAIAQAIGILAMHPEYGDALIGSMSYQRPDPAKGGT